MALTRRQFLTLTGGSAAAAILFQACGVPQRELIVQSPLEMPEDLVTGLDNWYVTACRQCATSDGGGGRALSLFQNSSVADQFLLINLHSRKNVCYILTSTT